MTENRINEYGTKNERMSDDGNKNDGIKNDGINNDGLRAALQILQWVLGLVILGESLRFAFSPDAARVFANIGLPNFLHLGLACAEIAAAILFLIPRTMLAGGRLLIVVFMVAITVHLLHGWYDVGNLVIYGAATWAVMAGKSSSISHEKRV
jgi:hypothetical protein